MADKHRYRLIATLREILGRGTRARTPVATTLRRAIGFADWPTCERAPDGLVPAACSYAVWLTER